MTVVVRNLEDAVEIINIVAPEHLELLGKAQNLYDRVTNAGAVFLGDYTPVSVGDYMSGTNHVLPTGGTAAFFSPLGVYDFMKRSSFVKYSQKALAKEAYDIDTLARLEGFYYHAESVWKRLN
jgi:histidinol dehydrogenase